MAHTNGGSADVVLGVPCVGGDLDSAEQAVMAMARDGRGGYACFCNVHVLMLAQRDPTLREALHGARAVFPDARPSPGSSDVAATQALHGSPVPT